MSFSGVRTIRLAGTLATVLWLNGALENCRLFAQAGIPEEMRRALEHNAGALSPLTVTWVRQRTSDLPVKDVLTKLKYPPTALDIMAPKRVQFKWQHGMYYVHNWDQMPQVSPEGKFLIDKPLVTYERETSFDGKAYYNGNPNRSHKVDGATPIINIDRIDRLIKDLPGMYLVDADYLEQAGFKMPRTPPEFKQPQSKSLVLYWIEQGARVAAITHAELSGAPCQMLELITPDRKIRFYLDPTMNYAVLRRMEWSLSGALGSKSDCSGFVKLSNAGLWLPKRVDVDWHTHSTIPENFSKEALFKETFTVSELDNQAIPSEQFALSYRVPGTYVADGTLPGAENTGTGRITYQVPADANELDQVIQAATEGQKFVPKGRWRVLVLITVVNVVALAVVAVIWVRRRYGQRSS